MMEQLYTPRHERQARVVTGLFRLSMLNLSSEPSAAGRVMPPNEPRFAVKDVPVVHTSAGWSEFAKVLANHFSETRDIKLQEANFLSAAESPINELTDKMSPGEIRLVDPEEYAEAYIKKYGDAIQGPLFL